MVYTMSPQYIAMSACDGFSNFPTMAEGPHQSNALHDDDALANDDVLDGCMQSNPPDSESQSNFHAYGKDQPRILGAHGSKLKATTAERRATHNAIERARRESLNGRFLELARALPTMRNVKRPSKSVIVNKSLEWICESQVREHDLTRENAFLRNHVNELRAQLQMEPLPHNRALFNPPQAPYKFAGAHSQRATGVVDNALPFSSTQPAYPSQCHPPMAAQHSQSYATKQRPLAASNVHEGQSSPPTQPGDNCKSMAGPFSTPHPHQGQHGYLALNMYESSDGSDKTIEKLKLSRSQSFGPVQKDENISSIYFPGLSIHTDSSSPFQALSESDGLLSTAGSSPPRLRYFSSSGSSDASDHSPSHHDYPHAAPHFETERKSYNNEAPADRFNSGAVQVGILGGPVAPPVNHHHGGGLPGQSEIRTGVSGTIRAATNMDVTLPMETKLGCNPTSFVDPHSLPVQRQPSHPVQFPPPNYVGSLHTSSELFDENSQSLPHIPRVSLAGGTPLDASILPIPPVVNPGAGGANNENSSGFPIGAAWVWG